MMVYHLDPFVLNAISFHASADKRGMEEKTKATGTTMVAAQNAAKSADAVLADASQKGKRTKEKHHH